MSVTRLDTKVLEKVWGTPKTSPWHDNPAASPIGEIWFGASDSVPLLVKLLFTSDNLSVQVHPDDAYALTRHQSRGKTEMWHILRADPGAKIAVALKESITPGHLRQASLSGEIMDLLNWIEVLPGQTYFVPAGTIHALGAGLAVCEVQQHSDVTYRLYDYGRPRELHLDHGIAVSQLCPYDAFVKPLDLSPAKQLLAESQYFRTEKWTVKGVLGVPNPAKPTIYIALEGEGTIAGTDFRAGEAFEAAADTQGFDIAGESAVFLVTSEPA